MVRLRAGAREGTEAVEHAQPVQVEQAHLSSPLAGKERIADVLGGEHTMLVEETDELPVTWSETPEGKVDEFCRTAGMDQLTRRTLNMDRSPGSHASTPERPIPLWPLRAWRSQMAYLPFASKANADSQAGAQAGAQLGAA